MENNNKFKSNTLKTLNSLRFSSIRTKKILEKLDFVISNLSKEEIESQARKIEIRLMPWLENVNMDCIIVGGGVYKVKLSVEEQQQKFYENCLLVALDNAKNKVRLSDNRIKTIYIRFREIYRKNELCKKKENELVEFMEEMDSYIMVALQNLNYSDNEMKNISLEVDRLAYEAPKNTVKNTALQINKRVFSELYY